MRFASKILLFWWVSLLTSFPLQAQDVPTVTVMALSEDKAVLSIDEETVVLKEGESSPQGVTLLEVDSSHAVIAYQGIREELTLASGQVLLNANNLAKDQKAADKRVVLYSETNNMFHADGEINGKPVRFVVDTGATSVALSGRLADAIGLRYRDAQPAIAQTASGLAPVYRVTLERVKVGGITLRYIDGAVVEGDYPAVPLLGMSFLGKLEMQRSGRQMILQMKN